MGSELEEILDYRLEIYDNVQDELRFDVVDIGITGDVELIKRNEKTANGIPILSTLPHGLPPIFQTPKEQVQDYFLHPEDLPIHDVTSNQRYWPREFNPEDLFRTEYLPNPYRIDVERNDETGEVDNFSEVLNSEAGLSAKNSMSLLRLPGLVSESIKGQSTNYPFLPGGMDVEMKKDFEDADSESIAIFEELLNVPPGFQEPVFFETNVLGGDKVDDKDVLDIGQILSAEVDLKMLIPDELEEEIPTKTPFPTENDTGSTDSVEEERSNKLDDILEERKPEGKEKEQVETKIKWAVEEKIVKKVEDFHRLVPDMAFKFPFELDSFQKQAIIHLEKHESVYVSAHTSAGKTVVAEYAVALSQRHMTKAVYTSPIKALSNQKFRDFKTTFSDVGLLTGDVQINPTASCLIMTTEILRSMLYNGSDVIRDVEWVIFDEVHYINDAERGVVWEEVLIMLPEHISVILLSATASNVLKFAEWIGQTKKKHIYVISTEKRPVPLEHYLFTGTNTKTLDELFMIMNSKGEFLEKGLKAAANAKTAKKPKAKDAYGPKGGRQGAPKQDRHIWQAAIEMLRRKEQLPAIAFTFSKKRCDENAIMLRHIDLMTTSEKSEIKVFTRKCISKLKGSDQKLPQVVWMESLLERGFGVHHSGILPILKEIIEMLFQRGLVKLLFATETFAMGVNMPAKTVLFDNTRKHDGVGFRNLLPNEYIQMAGRAGRRGLDTTGLVIMLCKGDVPNIEDLKQMMMGKPKALESQFHLTYSMILNLLRVEQLRVEDMMKRSYSEFDKQKGSWERARELRQLEEQLKQAKAVECSLCLEDLKDYFLVWSEIHSLQEEVMKVILSSPSGQRSLSVGRVITISNFGHKNALAVVLQQGGLDPVNTSLSVSSSNKTSPLEATYSVLVLCEKTAKLSGEGRKHPVFSTKLFVPEGSCSQSIEEICGRDIVDISTEYVKIDPERIIANHQKRLIPRFRDEDPSPSVVHATQELLRILERNPNGLNTMHPIRDLRLKDIDFVENFQRLESLKDRVTTFRCLMCPQFIKHFKTIQNRAELADNCKQLRHLLSEESLELLPDYKKRIEVLRQLRYIDSRKVVQLKGRVACELSNHQLMITELLFQASLTNLQPAEIVALLSVFVCEEKKSQVEPKLNERLLKGKGMIITTAQKIANIQLDCGLDTPVDEYLSQFRFGLVEVVYEWALGTPFVDIVSLTDISEGIIVRCIQRLEEVCRDVRNAARVIGDSSLQAKMEEGSSRIKRDIVFAASLYTS